MSCNTCSTNKLQTFNWLDDLPVEEVNTPSIVEVHFKNTRKAFYSDSLNLKLKRGDIVAVEASHGHDIGTVGLTGRLAQLQFEKRVRQKDRYELRTVFRIATQRDIAVWNEAKAMEMTTLLKSRKSVEVLGLEMKISDIEFQGDGRRATFYYIANGRIDFRELIKLLSYEFKVKIEMMQIGARQEAGMIGSLGSCGRELCCSTWRTRLPTIQQSVIYAQNLSSNIDKFMGHCGKLKCCLTYEIDNYIDAQKDFPVELLELDVKEGTLYPFKTDILKRTIWYSTSKNIPENLVELNLTKINEILLLNKKAITPKRSEI